jgi:hypothetical protein
MGLIYNAGLGLLPPAGPAQGRHRFEPGAPEGRTAGPLS